MALDADEEEEAVDQKEYRSMIGSLLYLMLMRLDIQLVVSVCALSGFAMHISLPSYQEDHEVPMIHS
jgi:hypothetical protein